MITPMSKPTANLRLFVAIYPPPALAAAMLEALAGLQLPPHRPTLAEQVHLTLQFIGDTPSRELEQTLESVRRAAGGLSAFALAPARLIHLPQRGPARLVAAQTDAPATLLELHRRLVARLARPGSVRGRKDERFRPHLTLCRFRSPTRGVALDQALTLPPFPVARIALMRSTLSAEHATHHEVAGCDLI
jgi:2'-5' RNA ligase